MKELGELRAKKEEERVVQEAAIAEVDNHHSTIVTSWKYSLKMTRGQQDQKCIIREACRNSIAR